MSRARLEALPVTIIGILMMGFVALSVAHESAIAVAFLVIVVIVGIVGEIYFALGEASDKNGD